MAFADPQSVTINAVAQSMPRISSAGTSGKFATNDGAYLLSVSHDKSKRNRHLIRIDAYKNAVNPLIAGANIPVSMSCYLVCDVPLVGYTVAEQKLVVDGFIAYLTASSGAQVTKLLGGEN